MDNPAKDKNADKPARRQRRTKASIVECLQHAAEEEISQHGFADALVTNIIKRAQVEPQVFYNRYKDLNEFYDQYVKKYDSWMSEVLKTEAPLLTKAGLSEFIHKLVTSLYQDPVIVELLRWELSTKNQITLRTAALREQNMAPLARGLSRKFKGTNINPGDVAAICAGGIYYIALYGKLGSFRGIDFSTEEGRKKIEDTVALIVEQMFAEVDELDQREQQIADRLRAAGVSESIIEQALSK